MAGAMPTVMRNGTIHLCLLWTKNNIDLVGQGR